MSLIPNFESFKMLQLNGKVTNDLDMTFANEVNMMAQTLPTNDNFGCCFYTYKCITIKEVY